MGLKFCFLHRHMTQQDKRDPMLCYLCHEQSARRVHTGPCKHPSRHTAAGGGSLPTGKLTYRSV